MVRGLVTFHRILSGCESGSVEAWKAFLEEYSPVALELCRVYFPSPASLRMELWRVAVARLRERDCVELRKLDHQGEREFLAGLRTLLLLLGGERLPSSAAAADGLTPSVEAVQALLKDQLLVHQQILFLKLAGYSNGTLEKILMVSPRVAKDALERLRAGYPAALGQREDRCLWPGAWNALLHRVQSSRSDHCPSLRQFVRMLDGQATWYDKTPIEQHMGQCLHCLERWTALREVVFWRREAPRLPAEDVETLLAELSFARPHKKRKPFLNLLFGE